MGVRSVFGVPERPELKKREIMLQTSQPDLERGGEKKETASPCPNQEMGRLELKTDGQTQGHPGRAAAPWTVIAVRLRPSTCGKGSSRLQRGAGWRRWCRSVRFT